MHCSDHTPDDTIQQEVGEYEVRLRKYQAIAARDGVVCKDKFQRTHTIAEAQKLAEGEEVALCGRITALRWFGKLVFGKLYDAGGSIQFSLSKNELDEEAFAFVKANADVGDYIGISGAMYYTQKGEFTLKGSRCAILSKALRPLPEKFHGITDVDRKFRQRYLDVIMNESTRNTLAMRIQMLRFIRNFLDEAGFVEVETPILQNVASGAAARPFVTRHNALDTEFYLRIAPELFLKQVIACGFDKVFELGKNFRNEGMDAMHLQEFTMLEWYASYWDFNDNIDFVTKMIQGILMELRGTLQIEYQGEALDFSRLRRVDYIAELNKILETDILSYESAQDLANHIIQKNIFCEEDLKDLKSLPAIVDFTFKRKLRPSLVQPCVTFNYPAFLIPLARRNDLNPKAIDMFQVVVCGAEIVKAYSELVDPILQRGAFEEQVRNKSTGDDEAFDLDESFLLAMEHGMPPMSGLGFGIDRFMSIVADQPTLRDVIFFPQMKV
ncbi:MAG: lysine--tRNA ligase [Oscillospiraceae bacterium]|nr:lysine--tRNA ligase [Oscillospiraceae bacterium]